MRSYHFDPAGELPVVKAILKGPTGNKRVFLIFDSGATLTQINGDVLKFIGFKESDKIDDVDIVGVSGPAENTGLYSLEKLSVLGKNFVNTRIASIDFSKWQDDGLDGLLGWDLIKQFHFEVDAPRGLLKVLG